MLRLEAVGHEEIKLKLANLVKHPAHILPMPNRPDPIRPMRDRRLLDCRWRGASASQNDRR
jgi:hypothetical protein